jgi:SP family general alpha glucoside:H+ symporter-like MFS transporter
MLTSTARKVVSKACDACRRRKTKCDGVQPCLGCRSANLACTFDAPRGQGGNRGARAIVLNELRAKSKDHSSFSENLPPAASSLSPDITGAQDISDEPPLSDVLGECMDAYVKYLYPVVPLLDMAFIKAQASQADRSPMSHQFVQAFCAYVSNFGHLSDGGGPESLSEVAGKQLLETATSAQSIRLLTQPTPTSVYISFFLYGAWAGLGDYQQAWYYLREATTLFLMLRNNHEDWYDEETQRCLFWVLLVSER